MPVDPRLYSITPSHLRNATIRLLVFIKETKGTEHAKLIIKYRGRSLNLDGVLDIYLDDLFDAALNEVDQWTAQAIPGPWPA